MHILGCLDRPTAGVYRFEGVDVSGLDDDGLARIRNRRVGFVFQNFNLLPGLSALEQVEVPMVYAGISTAERRRRAQRALEMVGLAHRAAHRPNELSGGEQQRVAIARALVMEPALLLADEPTGNLDSERGRQVLDLLTQLNSSQGVTVILVTHDPEIARRARRIISIRDGRIIGDERQTTPA
jgi:putative ABC transport system ATP-binding protein